MDLRLDKKLPVALRNEFWTQLTKSVEDEILTMKSEMDRKKWIYAIQYAQKEDLYDFASIVFGLPFQVFLNLENALINEYGYEEEDILLFLRKELQKIPFNIVNKGGIQHYQSFFKTYGFSFPYQLSIYVTVPEAGNNLLTGHPLIARDLQYFLADVASFIEAYGYEDDENTSIGDSLGTIGFYGSTALFEQKSTQNFIGAFESVDDPTLDEERELDDEESEITHLDFTETDTIQGTRHVGFEIVLRNVTEKNGEEVLLPFEIIRYIKEQIFYYRRVSEIPHVGSQLSVFIDSTGYWDINASQLVRENTVQNSEFTRDSIWIRGDNWIISGGKARRSTGSPATNIFNPFVQFEEGEIYRLSFEVEEIAGESYIVDSEDNILYSFSTPGQKEIDITWLTQENGFGFRSSTVVEISYAKVQKVEFYSAVSARLRSSVNLPYSDENITEITGMEFGYGEQRLPERNDETYEFPTSVEKPLALNAPINPKEVFFDDLDYIGAIVEFSGQHINNIILHDNTGYVSEETGEGEFNSTNTEFSGSLPSRLVPIKPKNVTFSLVNYEGSEPVIEDFIQDDGSGNLLGSLVKGEINYITGAYSFTTNFEAYTSEEVSVGEGEITTISGNTDSPIIQYSGVLFFEINGSQYYIGEDTEGNLFSNHPAFNENSSSITYDSLETSFEFIFDSPIIPENVRFNYTHQQEEAFDSNYKLELYRAFTNQPYPVTEIGIYGKTETTTEPVLIAYLTCSPIELYSNELHLNMGVIIER